MRQQPQQSREPQQGQDLHWGLFLLHHMGFTKSHKPHCMDEDIEGQIYRAQFESKPCILPAMFKEESCHTREGESSREDLFTPSMPARPKTGLQWAA